jgi:lipopolysaccharide export LptBFGC system permease protein LptF
MGSNKQRGNNQQGLSLVGLIFLLAIVGFFAVLGLKVVPTYIEYRAVANAIKTAKAAGSTVLEIRTSFDKNANVNYIESITGKDLLIDKDNGELEVSFAYQKKIPLVGPASLVLDYAGSTAKGGAPVKPAE